MEYGTPQVTILRDIGHTILKGNACRDSASVTIFVPSSVDDGAYSPAQDILVFGVPQLTQLREVIDEVIRLATEHKVPPVT